jgi:hypothetical protein
MDRRTTICTIHTTILYTNAVTCATLHIPHKMKYQNDIHLHISVLSRELYAWPANQLEALSSIDIVCMCMIVSLERWIYIMYTRWLRLRYDKSKSAYYSLYTRINVSFSFIWLLRTHDICMKHGVIESTARRHLVFALIRALYGYAPYISYKTKCMHSSSISSIKRHFSRLLLACDLTRIWPCNKYVPTKPHATRRPRAKRRIRCISIQ